MSGGSALLATAKYGDLCFLLLGITPDLNVRAFSASYGRSESQLETHKPSHEVDMKGVVDPSCSHEKVEVGGRGFISPVLLGHNPLQTSGN